MQILRVFSVLLDYPTSALQDARPELEHLVRKVGMDAGTKQGLYNFIAKRCEGSLLDWQSEYDGLFERGRSLSLLLFEHIHGESRDRGQAMVDLLNQYETAGLVLSAKELPDYLPLYLEFLSTQGEENAKLGLQEIAHILALLACRLDERKNNYAAVLHGLLALSEARVDLADVKHQLRNEPRDDTPQALDKVWEEEAVSFGAESAKKTCSTANYRPSANQLRDEQVLDITAATTLAKEA